MDTRIGLRLLSGLLAASLCFLAPVGPRQALAMNAGESEGSELLIGDEIEFKACKLSAQFQYLDLLAEVRFMDDPGLKVEITYDDGLEFDLKVTKKGERDRKIKQYQFLIDWIALLRHQVGPISFTALNHQLSEQKPNYQITTHKEFEVQPAVATVEYSIQHNIDVDARHLNLIDWNEYRASAKARNWNAIKKKVWSDSLAAEVNGLNFIFTYNFLMKLFEYTKWRVPFRSNGLSMAQFLTSYVDSTRRELQIELNLKPLVKEGEVKDNFGFLFKFYENDVFHDLSEEGRQAFMSEGNREYLGEKLQELLTDDFSLAFDEKLSEQDRKDILVGFAHDFSLVVKPNAMLAIRYPGETGAKLGGKAEKASSTSGNIGTFTTHLLMHGTGGFKPRWVTFANHKGVIETRDIYNDRPKSLSIGFLTEEFDHVARCMK